MKNSIFSALLAIILLASCTRTTYTSTSANMAAADVPEAIRTNFSTSYPTAADVVWKRFEAEASPIDLKLADWRTMDAEDYVAEFTMDNKRYYAWYDNSGTWVGSSYVVVDHATLPMPITDLVRNRYSGYVIEKAQKEMWKDMEAYEIKLKRGDNDKVKLLVDPNGNIIKEKLKE